MKFLLAFSISVLLSLTLFALPATDLTLTGCTRDKVAVKHGVALDSEGLTAHPQAPQHIQSVFTTVASHSTYEYLVSRDGFMTFMTSLDAQDRDAIGHMHGAPSSAGRSCEPVKSVRTPIKVLPA